MSSVVRADELTADQVTRVRAIVDAAWETDGVHPLSEQFLLRLRTGRSGAVHLLAGVDRPTGYAQLDPDDPAGTAAEVVVHPAHRRQGIGTALVRAAAGTDPRLRVWAHGELPAAAGLAAHLGYVRSRSLWRMRRPLTGPDVPDLPEPRLPPGVEVRAFRPGRDERAWLEVNARAFAHHPEQGRVSEADLLERERSDWFAADGFFLAFRGERLVGFHWTKVEQGSEGEVYVLGVDPSEQGSGLGKALLLVGLRYLARPKLALDAVTLYVEEDNEPAVALYRKLGFDHVGTDTMFRSAGTPGVAEFDVPTSGTSGR
ncbi:MAG TPA: mycothiol synthase [Streptosporangiales bacterium]